MINDFSVPLSSELDPRFRFVLGRINRYRNFYKSTIIHLGRMKTNFGKFYNIRIKNKNKIIINFSFF